MPFGAVLGFVVESKYWCKAGMATYLERRLYPHGQCCNGDSSYWVCTILGRCGTDSDSTTYRLMFMRFKVGFVDCYVDLSEEMLFV